MSGRVPCSAGPHASRGLDSPDIGYNPNYVLRSRNPFYPEMPPSRQGEANPVYRITRCYNEISNKLENSTEFSMEINKVAVLFKMHALKYK